MEDHLHPDLDQQAEGAAEEPQNTAEPQAEPNPSEPVESAAPAEPVAAEESAEAAEPTAAGQGTEERVDYSEGVARPRPGDIMHGRIVQIADDHVLVDVGYKSEGVIPLSELTYRKIGSAAEAAELDAEIDAMVLSVDGEEGSLRLSKRRADEAEAWNELKDAYEAGTVIEAPIVEAVKGGLVSDIGARGFIPASQVERGYAQDLEPYVGQTLRVKIIELDRAKHRVILSRKVVLEEERKQNRERIWSGIEEEQVLHGTVKSLTDFGAFIDLGGVDGLLHVSEMSWGRIQHPSEVLHEGQEIDVKVLRLDRERGRISLGYKQVLPNPWDSVEERYPIGSIVRGKVVRLATFGAFVELEPGIDGLVHISQLADHHVTRPGEVVSVGEEVEVKILRVDPAERRVSLSLRDAGGYQSQKREPYQEGSTAPEGDGATIGDLVGDDFKDLLE
ncbi:MAG: 30S ribosomal protein S1 [Thermaerobacter sp.]|nr:30S ribosomal protein S1 [Thermaerobacter sp.]